MTTQVQDIATALASPRMGMLYNADGFRERRVEVAYIPEDATTCAIVRINDTEHRADDLTLTGASLSNGVWSVTLE